MPNETMTIPEWFAKYEYKTALHVLSYLADQYYIYGPDRSNFTAGWTSALRSAVSRDALHFVEYYEDSNARSFYERHSRDPWHGTNRVLEEIFKDVQEISCYRVLEKDELRAEFMQGIYESWNRAKKQDFKNKLNGKEEFNW